MSNVPEPFIEVAGSANATVVKWVIIAFLVVVLAPVLLLSLIIVQSYLERLLFPLDEELIEALDEQRPILERAVELTQQINFTATIWRGPEKGASRELVELESIIGELDIEYISMRRCLEFVFGSGPASAYEYKALIWCGMSWKPEPGISRLVDITDPYHNYLDEEETETNPEYRSDGSLYRHIRGDWYIRYHYED